MKRNTKNMFHGQLRVMSDREYDRINSEMQKRIGMVFSQGFTLVTMVVAIWALTITILGISIDNENNEMNIFVISDNMWQLLLLGGFMTVLFAVPVFLVLPFAVKSHDNIRGLSSLSAYIKIFYDLPSLLGKRTNIRGTYKKECTAWETFHCEADIPNAWLFNIEYKIITVISMIFSGALGVAVIACLSAAIYQYGGWNILWLIIYSGILVALQVCLGIFFVKPIFKYSSTTASVAAYLKIYQRRYLRDAVDLGIISKEDYEHYLKWDQTIAKRDENLRRIYIEMEKMGRKHPGGSENMSELLNDVYDYETVCIPLKVRYLQKKLKITDKKGTLGRLYHGQEFDSEDAVYKKLLRKSEDLCAEYTRLCGILRPNKRQESRKSEILDILFPDHGVIYGVGAGIHVVAGMVDLGDNIYINSNVCFNSDVHIRTGDYFICAPNVTFGSENKTNKVQDIIIEDDVWIGADAKIARGAIIGKGCVVAMGARVQAEAWLDPMTVYGGNPALGIRTIEGPRNDEDEEIPELFWGNLEFLKQHYLSLGVIKAGDDSTEFENFLHGIRYNSLNAFMGAVNSYSHSVCAAYMIADSKKRKSMLPELFPIMGTNCTVGKNLQLDTIGSVILGNNVQIGNNVTLMGNINIGNNCEIGDTVSIIAVGHDVYYMGRHVTEMDHSPYMKNTSGYVIIHDGVHIHNGAKVLANREIVEDIEANILIVGENAQIAL